MMCNLGDTYFNIETVKLLLGHPNIKIKDNTLEKLILKNLPRDGSYAELLISKIYCSLNFDCNILIGSLSYYNNVKRVLKYYGLHTNIKKKILENLPNVREELYCRPDNIIALCSEVNFKLKFKNKTEIFEELDDKLKSLFDIKNVNDMIEKISYHL